jgi:hypothetical protein
MAGSQGAGAVPGDVAKYVAGVLHVALSHEATTPGPMDSAASAWLEPPPAARQNTSEMHDREVKPPAGGSDVAGWDQPRAGTTGVGTVVGTADGRVVVVGAEDIVVGASEVGVTWRTSVVAVDAQAVLATATSTVRVEATLLARRRSAVTAPPSRSDRRTAWQG